MKSSGLDAAGGKVHVKGDVLALELSQELLGELVEDLVLVVLGDLVELQALAHLLDDAVLLELRQGGLLVGLDLLLDGLAELLDGLVAKVLLGELVGELGGDGLLDGLDGHLDGELVLVDLALVLVGLDPLDVLGLAGLHADDGLLELGGELHAVQGDGAVLGGEVAGRPRRSGCRRR